MTLDFYCRETHGHPLIVSYRKHMTCTVACNVHMRTVAPPGGEQTALNAFKRVRRYSKFQLIFSYWPLSVSSVFDFCVYT